MKRERRSGPDALASGPLTISILFPSSKTNHSCRPAPYRDSAHFLRFSDLIYTFLAGEALRSDIDKHEGHTSDVCPYDGSPPCWLEEPWFSPQVTLFSRCNAHEDSHQERIGPVQTVAVLFLTGVVGDSLEHETPHTSAAASREQCSSLQSRLR